MEKARQAMGQAIEADVAATAAAYIPPPLVEQLGPGGRMVIPIGEAFALQQLMLVEKDQQGNITVDQVLPVRFVPLTGDGRS